MPLKDDIEARGWLLKPHREQQPPPTHLFLDGGRAAVPDEFAGTFLNMYTRSVLKGEKVYAVELKTALFKLFMDVDAQFARKEDADDMYSFFVSLDALAATFFPGHQRRVIVCAAPPKTNNDGTIKLGFHLHWPGVVTNSPIALAFRAHALEELKQCPGTLNSLEDVLDACVFKANGLRMVYSGKVDEYRAYTPVAEILEGVVEVVQPDLNAAERRQYVHDLSLRTFGDPLTPCANGIDRLADDAVFAHAKHRAGTSVRLEAYADVLPILHALLPSVYETQHFTGCFRTEHAMMFKSSSRFCQHVDREHRTSNVYFAVTRRGLAQRCYCRKDDRGCVEFCSVWIPVPEAVINELFPAAEPDDRSVHCMPSKKSKADLKSILQRSRPVLKKKKR